MELDIAGMEEMVAVGFGLAYVTKDGEIVYDGERDLQEGNNPKTIGDIEKLALMAPDAVWRVVLYGPLSGVTYQRQSNGQWLAIERNKGFA